MIGPCSIKKGLILGIHCKENNGDPEPELEISQTAQNMNSATAGELLRSIELSGFKGKAVRITFLVFFMNRVFVLRYSMLMNHFVDIYRAKCALSRLQQEIVLTQILQ